MISRVGCKISPGAIKGVKEGMSEYRGDLATAVGSIEKSSRIIQLYSIIIR